jgi:hypothetical protein
VNEKIQKVFPLQVTLTGVYILQIPFWREEKKWKGYVQEKIVQNVEEKKERVREELN